MLRETTRDTTDRPQRARRRNPLRALEVDLRMIGMVGAMFLIWLGFDIFTNGIFLSARNLWNLAVQTSVVGIMATGMVLVIVVRQIDLSVGSLLGFSGMVMAVVQVSVFPIDAGWTWAATLLVGLAVGAAVGAFQGWWIAYRAVPGFIVTLAGLLIYRGGAWLLTSGRTVAPLNPTFELLGGGIDGSIGARWSWVVGIAAIVVLVIVTLRARQRRVRFGFPLRPRWAEALVLLVSVAAVVAFVLVMNAYDKPRTDIPQGIPIPVLILIGVTIAMTALARLTRFGRYVYAMGGSPEAAELAGIDTRRILLFVFILMGVLSALAGAVATARLSAGANSTGTLAELYTIAAAVIGGSSLAGGAGTVVGAIIGAVIMQSLQSGMVLIGVTSALQQVIIGLVLILAVWIDVVYRKRSGLGAG